MNISVHGSRLNHIRAPDLRILKTVDSAGSRVVSINNTGLRTSAERGPPNYKRKSADRQQRQPKDLARRPEEPVRHPRDPSRRAGDSALRDPARHPFMGVEGPPDRRPPDPHRHPGDPPRRPPDAIYPDRNYQYRPHQVSHPFQESPTRAERLITSHPERKDGTVGPSHNSRDEERVGVRDGRAHPPHRASPNPLQQRKDLHRAPMDRREDLHRAPMDRILPLDVRDRRRPPDDRLPQGPPSDRLPHGPPSDRLHPPHAGLPPSHSLLDSRNHLPPDRRRLPNDDPRGPPADDRRGNGPPMDDRRGPPMDDRRGPPIGDRRGPPIGDRRGPPIDDRRVPPIGDRRGPPINDRRGPPIDDRRVPPIGDRRGPPIDDRRGPPINDRRGPPIDDRRGPPIDDRRGPRHPVDDRRGPPIDISASFADRRLGGNPEDRHRLLPNNVHYPPPREFADNRVAPLGPDSGPPPGIRSRHSLGGDTRHPPPPAPLERRNTFAAGDRRGPPPEDLRQTKRTRLEEGRYAREGMFLREERLPPSRGGPQHDDRLLPPPSRYRTHEEAPKTRSNRQPKHQDPFSRPSPRTDKALSNRR